MKWRSKLASLLGKKISRSPESTLPYHREYGTARSLTRDGEDVLSNGGYATSASRHSALSTAPRMSVTSRRAIDELVAQDPDFIAYRYPSTDQGLELVTKPLCTSCMHFSRCTFSRSRLILSGLCASPSLIPFLAPTLAVAPFPNPNPLLCAASSNLQPRFISVVRSPNPLVDTSCFHRVLYHSHGLSPVFACNVILSRSRMKKCVIGLLHFGRLA